MSGDTGGSDATPATHIADDVRWWYWQQIPDGTGGDWVRRAPTGGFNPMFWVESDEEPHWMGPTVWYVQ